MLIGIDASRAVCVAPTGTETYSRELIRALVALDQANSYRLYTRGPVSPDFFGATRNVQVRALTFPRLWTFLRLAPEMALHPPDVLFVPAHILPPIHPRRSIVTVHDLGHLHFPQAYTLSQRLYHTWATRWNCWTASHLLADSEATRDDMVRLCQVAPGKISVVYPAYDSGLYRAEHSEEKVAEVVIRLRIAVDYVLAIGTIHPRKNYALLMEAFAKLISLPRYRKMHLVIVGGKGWLYEKILAKARSLGLARSVRFLDYVPARDMPVLVSGARLLAFPSLHEGFGIPILEAQACGTPVVCSMTSSLPEAAGDGAVFVDPLDSDALCAAMERVMEDQALRGKLVRNGFENIKRFSWETSARQVLQIVRELE